MTDKLSLVLDKQKTLQAANEVGLTIPYSIEPKTLQEAQELANTFSFPAVLKWKDPNAIVPMLQAHGLQLVKAEYIYTPTQWLEVVARYAALGQWPMVQAYCPGQGLGQFFFMHKGQALRRFQHLRIAEWPPEGGFSSVCDALPLDQCQALQERSIALLRHIGWEGTAMVEYRYNARNQEAVLMEINGRYWGSFPLAVHCGCGFSLLAYQACMELHFTSLPPPIDNIRCRMMATELKRLVRIFFQAERISDKSFVIRRSFEIGRFFSDFFRPRVHYYVWSIQDPKPFFADLSNLLRTRLRLDSRIQGQNT
jgi:predicted ATP-grasp superfamily ATP-dependent carboligase